MGLARLIFDTHYGKKPSNTRQVHGFTGQYHFGYEEWLGIVLYHWPKEFSSELEEIQKLVV